MFDRGFRTSTKPLEFQSWLEELIQLNRLVSIGAGVKLGLKLIFQSFCGRVYQKVLIFEK